MLEAPDWGGGSGLRFAVVQCVDCTLAFTNPRPEEGCLARFYTSSYRPHQRPEAKRRGWLRRWLPTRWRPPFPWHGDGRLLDFGCGAGQFINRMKAWHWKATGIDLSQAAVERARRLTGLPVHVGSLPHPELEPNSFDVITMWHVLEHVPDPILTLQEARKLLTWNGKLVVGVPNLSGLGFRWFGPDWFGLDLPRHLTHFTPWTLQLMLERAGYRLESLRMDPRSSWLRHSARHMRSQRRQLGVRGWLQNRLASRLIAAMSRFTHQADALIATAQPVGM
jgi:SAM-dependent methyltransferase